MAIIKEEEIEEVGVVGARWLRSRYATWILAVIAFTESVFAPIIIDPFLIALIFAKRSAWLVYTSVAVIFSVLGGVTGYILGALFFEFIGTWVIEFYGFQNQFVEITSRLTENGFVFVLLGAVTPIPYKLVAIASGLIQVDFLTFLFASIFGRIIRLGLVGYATYAVGPRALPIIRKHLLTLAYVFGVILLIYIIVKFLF